MFFILLDPPEKPVLAWEREARHTKKHLKALWRVSKRGFSWGFDFGDIWQAFVNLMGVATEERKEQDTKAAQEYSYHV